MSGETYPKMLTASSGNTYGACEVCPLIRTCTTSGCTNAYFAQSGTVTVSQAGKTNPGTMSASAQNLTLVEWDFTQDAPLSGGRCITIDSATFNNVTTCHPAINEPPTARSP